MKYKLIKITEDELHYTDEYNQPQNARVHELIWQKALSRFSKVDRITIHQQAQNDHGDYATDRCGRLLWTPLDMYPVFCVLLAICSLFLLMSVLCVFRTTSVDILSHTFVCWSDLLYIPMAFLCLETLQELFGKKATQSTVIALSLALMFAGVMLNATLNIPGLFRGQNEASYLTIFKTYPSVLMISGLTLVLVHLINAGLFSHLRDFPIVSQSLSVRFLISTCVTHLSFTLISTAFIYIDDSHLTSTRQTLFDIACSSCLLRMSIALVAGWPLLYIMVKIAHTWGRKKSAMAQLHEEALSPNL